MGIAVNSAEERREGNSGKRQRERDERERTLRANIEGDGGERERAVILCDTKVSF